MNPVLMIGLVALLPLTALVTVIQKRPFYALISRGIMGMVAALIYAAMGAPDVALTEALMGTLLTVLLYLIAVRSSMVVQIGWLETHESLHLPNGSACDPLFEPIRRCCHSHYLELEIVRFTDRSAMNQALRRGHIHAVFGPSESDNEEENTAEEASSPRYVLRLAQHDRSLTRLFQTCFSDGRIAVVKSAGPEKG
jgi:putative multicomponent Na+:H+ antiporter subunit B